MSAVDQRSTATVRWHAWTLAGCSAALFISLLIWPPLFARWATTHPQAPTSFTLTLNVQVVRDMATNRVSLWDHPYMIGRNRYGELLRRADAGEATLPAEYIAKIQLTAGPPVLSIGAPLWQHRRFTARVDESASISGADPGPPLSPSELEAIRQAGPASVQRVLGDDYPEIGAAVQSLRPGESDRVLFWPGLVFNLALLIVFVAGVRLAQRSNRHFVLLRSREIKARPPHGSCPACGYPLLAASQDRCSECGEALGVVDPRRVIVIDGHDVMFFESAAAAASALEPSDVLSGCYEVFTARGGAIALRVRQTGDSQQGVVTLEPSAPTVGSCARLVRLLNRALRAAGDEGRYNALQLDRAVRSASLVFDGS